MGQKLDFKISTALKDIIGKDLITEAYTAVFELVKNSYDAGATRVDIVFQDVTANNKQGKILIMDDGEGMSIKDIQNKWLFVGYSEKKMLDPAKEGFKKKSAGSGRVMAGIKGIGRFSADRLGRHLDLYTKTRDGNTVHRVRVDWKSFEGNQDKEFQKVGVEYEALDEFPDMVARNRVHGTVLGIYNLSDKWDRNHLLRLKRYLQRLVNPIQIPSEEKFEIWVEADEFLESDRKLKAKGKPHEAINGKIDNIVFEKMGISTTQITCNITKSKIVTQIVDKGRFVFKTEELNAYSKYLYDINISVFYLNRSAKNRFRRVMGISSFSFGSIFLYKNGFRIHPYGEEKDDWLGLERRKGQGYSRYLSMRELMGRVEINRSQLGFEEVSSRHSGVVETEQYRQLWNFMRSRVIRWLERYVVEGLDWDRPKDNAKKSEEEIAEQSIAVLAKFTNQIKDQKKRIVVSSDFSAIADEKRLKDLPEVIKNLRMLAAFGAAGDEKALFELNLRRLEKIAKSRESEAVAKTKALKIMKKEILFLQKSQSRDTELTENYNHAIGTSTGNIETYLMRLMDAIRKNNGAGSLMRVAQMISKENQKIMRASSIITQANFDITTKETEADLVAYIVQYVNNVVAEWAEDFRFTFRNENTIFRIKFTPLEVSILVDNFITNARKANAENVTVEFSLSGRTLRVLIYDDGDGILDEHKDRVFNRGFTTTTGSGIGLSHVRGIVREMGGEVKFLGNGLRGIGNGACFEIVITDYG